MLTWKRSLACAVLGVAAAAPAISQTWGVGASYGSVNNVNDSVTLSGFKPSEYTLWVDYRMEKTTLLRMTYGSMWTPQALAGQTVETPTGGTVPGFKERINYVTVDVSYLFWDGFYAGGLFAGVGGYGFNPQTMPAEFAGYQDLDERVFGWNAGVDGEFRVTKSLAIVLRFTYHNISAHPHRQFVNADAGLVARF